MYVDIAIVELSQGLCKIFTGDNFFVRILWQVLYMYHKCPKPSVCFLSFVFHPFFFHFLHLHTPHALESNFLSQKYL